MCLRVGKDLCVTESFDHESCFSVVFSAAMRHQFHPKPEKAFVGSYSYLLLLRSYSNTGDIEVLNPIQCMCSLNELWLGGYESTSRHLLVNK